MSKAMKSKAQIVQMKKKSKFLMFKCYNNKVNSF